MGRDGLCEDDLTSSGSDTAKNKRFKGRKKRYYSKHYSARNHQSTVKYKKDLSGRDKDNITLSIPKAHGYMHADTKNEIRNNDREERPESQSDEVTQEIHKLIQSAERRALDRTNRSLNAAAWEVTAEHRFRFIEDDKQGVYSQELRQSAESVTAEEKREALKKSQKKAVKKRYQRQYRDQSKGYGIRGQIREAFGLPQGGITTGDSKKKSGSVSSAGRSRHLKHIIIVLLIFLVILMTAVGFITAVFQGGFTVISSTTYQSTDDEIHAAEDAYRALEEALDRQINEMEVTHPGYDEYQYQVDEINHNPFHLISYLTVLYGEFTIDDIREALNQIFKEQYTLYVWDETIENGKSRLNIALTNHGIDYVARKTLTEDGYNLYQVYNSTFGNRPELFDITQLPVEASTAVENGPTPEALSDVKFKRMYDEARKYLGYPYVWGGSSPSTSFDCSGFVSWVINNSGNGWNVGRSTAEGLRNGCSYVPADEAKPGDLIFFQGTYSTRGASHVGIVIGDGKMIHCGKPIQIASYKTPYWEKHFYQFGRIG